MDQDESSSMISSAKNTNYGIHQSNNSNYYKRAKHDHDQHNHRDYVDQTTNVCDISDNSNHVMINISSPSAKFKGVVPQQNGHWGAQIYANHQRIWLGTFKSEKAAAMAYDSAAIRLRNGDTHRNFPWTNVTLHEPDFQSQYTMEAILNMIKDGSYQSKFEEFLRNRSQKKEFVENNSVSTTNHHDRHHFHHPHHHFNQQIRVHGDAQFLCRQLFQKELTPSDVGKLNRLVIPKKYAVKYFPYISELDNNNNNTNNNPNLNMTNNDTNSCHNTTNNNNIVETITESGIEDIELVFYDKQMRSWRFRYCYWRSSQSFVFTRGWNRFVKENNLKANDVITFYTCHKCNVHGTRDENGQIFCLIDVTHNNGIIESQSCLNNSGTNNSNNIEVMKVDLDLDLDLDLNYHHHHEDKFDHEAIAISTTHHHEFKYKEVEASRSVEEKKFRLFGVDIK
ncbi:hypothetical protein CsatA_008683 [Cannabis sativa]